MPLNKVQTGRGVRSLLLEIELNTELDLRQHERYPGKSVICTAPGTLLMTNLEQEEEKASGLI